MSHVLQRFTHNRIFGWKIWYPTLSYRNQQQWIAIREEHTTHTHINEHIHRDKDSHKWKWKKKERIRHKERKREEDSTNGRANDSKRFSLHNMAKLPSAHMRITVLIYLLLCKFMHFFSAVVCYFGLLVRLRRIFLDL